MSPVPSTATPQRPSIRALRWLIPLVLALVFAGGAAFAAITKAGAALDAHFSSQGANAPAAAQEVPPPPGYASPRQTMTSFLRDIVRWRSDREEAALKAAVQALDLSQIAPADRRFTGPQSATRLLTLLDKIGRVDPMELPDSDAEIGSDRFVRTYTRADRPDVSIDVEFERLRPGQWLISARTLGRLAEWIAAYELVPTLAELGKPATLQEWVRSTVPAPMLRRVAFLEAWQWIGFAILVLVGLAAQRVVSFFFARLVAHLTSNERMAVDRNLLARVARPIALLATSIAFFAGVPLLDLNPRAYHNVNLLANVGLTIAVVWTAYRLVDVLAWVMAQKASRTETKFDDMLVPLLRRTLKVVVMILGFVLIVTRFNSDLWGLVAGLSIGSLAVGFAAKDSIENLFGTFTVLMDKPFQLGDLILVNGIEGSVEDVGFRSTRVRTPEDSLITVPNSRFIAAHVENRGLRRFRRVRATLGLTYDTPPERIEAFCEGIRELIRRHPYTRKNDYHIWMQGFGASSLDLQLTVFFETPDWPTECRERHRLYLDILRLAKRTGVEFAFPTQTVQWIQTAPSAPSPLEPFDQAIDSGRRAAGEVVDDSLGRFAGKKPAPVRFDTEDVDDAGPGRSDA